MNLNIYKVFFIPIDLMSDSEGDYPKALLQS